ncbi:unnamed protein product [Closterium sp. NIES-53]
MAAHVLRRVVAHFCRGEEKWLRGEETRKRCMRVHQRKYLEALAANFGQSEGHVATPFPSRFKCVKGPEEGSVGEEERRRFHSLVGSLMYAAVNTRPDVAFATGQLARVVQCPNEEQVAAGMRVAKYLGQTPTVGLQYSAAAQRRQKGADGVEPGHLFLTAFSDASYASEPEDMTSVGGFICCVGGGPTAWESKKQVDQALSSVEYEYMALFRAVREIVWQRRLLAELGEEQQGPTPLYCDSQGAIALAKNPVLHGLTKHMRVKWHWTRSMVAAGGSGGESGGFGGGGGGSGWSGGSGGSGSGGSRGGAVQRGGVHVRYGSTPLLVSPPVTLDSPVAPPPWSTLPATPSWHALPPPWPAAPAPHSSSFPPKTAPLQTLHMDVSGPASVSGQGRERYFLLVVDDHTCYTTVFPLCSKSEAPDVLIPWIHAVRLQLRERFHQDLPVLRLHSDRGGEFSSDLLRDFCRGEGILQSFTLPASPQQNRIAERRIGLVMEVWGSRAFVCDTSPDKLSARAIPCVFLGFSLDAPGWQFYHPTLRCVFPSEDVTFDESVPFYHLFPYRSAPLPPPPLFLAPRPPPVDPLPPQGPAPSGVSHVDPLRGAVLVKVAIDSGAARGAASGGSASGGAASGGAEPARAEPGGAEPEGAGSRGAELGGAEPSGAEPASAEPGGAESEGAESEGPAPRGTGAGGAGARGVGSGDTGAVDPGAGGACAGGAVSGGTGAGGTVQRRPFFAQPQPSSLPPPDSVLRQFLSLLSSTGLPPSLLSPSPRQSLPQFQPDSQLPVPSPNAEQTDSFTERCELESRPASPICAVRTGHRVPHPRPPPVPDTHVMALRPSSVPLRVPLPPPLESALPAVPDPESDLARAASPTVSPLLATVVTDPSFESTAASSLVAELIDFVAACRLDYATSLVAESESDCPPFVGGECALGTDVFEDNKEDFECLAAAVTHLVAMMLAPEGDADAPDIPTPRSYAEVIMGPSSSEWQIAMDAEMASRKSTGTYVDAVPPFGANIVDGMWILRVKRPPGSPSVFKARYVARGFSQRQGFDFFQTFFPTPKMTTLWVLLHVAAQRDYELHSLDFSITFLQGSLHEEIWLRRPPGFNGLFPAGTQWSLRRPVYGLRQEPREWHDTLRTTLAAVM